MSEDLACHCIDFSAPGYGPGTWSCITCGEPDKVTRVGGGSGKWEPIKISQRNSVYVPNLTKCASLLTRSRPHSYKQVISHRNRVRKPKNTSKSMTRESTNKSQERLAVDWVKNQSITITQAFHQTPFRRTENQPWKHDEKLGKLEPWIHRGSDHLTRQLEQGSGRTDVLCRH
jgi:hypothetical protein